MKKHFLLLLWMTLLPLAGWAASADLATKPTLATGLTYDGTAQALTTGSFVLPGDYDLTVGGVLWRVTTTADAPEPTAEGVAFADVKATNAGKYWVWYKVLRDNDQYQDDGDWTQIGTSFVRINKASLGFVEATPATGLVYNGTAQPLFTANATAANFATIQYSIWDTTLETPAWSDWTADVTAFTGTDAGSYSVKWQIANKADLLENLTDNESAYSGTFPDVMIAGAEITAEIDGTPAFTFNGQEQKPTIIVKSGETTLTAGTDYNITYWTDETRNTTQVAAPTDAKTYYILVSGINNYADHNVATLSYEIAKKSLADEDVTAVVSEAEIDKTYNGTAQKVSTGAVIVKAYVGTAGELTLAYGTDFTRENSTLENNTDVPAENATDEQKPRFKAVAKAGGNYTGERWVYFNIVPRSLSTVTISADLEADKTYTGLQITPSTEGMITYNTQTLLKGEDKDFTVAYGDNKNVVKDGEGNVVNGGTITITGTGNYTGEVVKNFKITPAELTVKAKNFSKNLGTADPTSDELAAGNYYEITGYVNEETAETAGVTGAPTFAISDHPETTGTHPSVISISAVTGLSAANYSFVAGAAANLIIGQGSVTVAATATEKKYGYKLPTLDKDAFGFTATGLVGAEEITALTFTVKDANNHEYAAGDMLEAGEYTITPSAATATSDSYVFEYTPATLTIKPYIVKFVAVNQTIDYGDEPGLAKNGKWNNVSNTTWNNNRLEMWYGEDENNLTKATTDEFFTTYSLWKQDFVESLTWEVAANKPVAEPGTIKVNLKADYDSKNFTVTTVPGNVTYNDFGGLVLTSTDADLAAIEAANGKNVNVKIDFSLRNGRNLGGVRNWGQYDWMTLTLPFDISVAELSQKLGYAIVNVIDPSRTVVSGESSEFYGKLTMTGGNGYVDPTDPDNDAKKDTKLAANKPFLVKTDRDINRVIDFGTQTIVAPAPADANALTVDAGQGATFVGTYAPITVDKTDVAKKWFMIGGGYGKWAFIGSSSAATWKLQPTEAYIQLPIETQSIIFNFEDVNGGTTAIKSIDVDNLSGKVSAEGWYTLNGMKLQTAPTEKGVYIKDGKKVVIK